MARWLGFVMVLAAGNAVIGDALALEPQVVWAPSASSPRPLDEAGLDGLEKAALHLCGAGDAGLAAAARTIAERRASAGGLANLDEIASAQRAAGEPHPWARAWAATAATLEQGALAERLVRWLGQGPREGVRRCGVASAVGAAGERTLVLLVANAIADLAPLPTRVRTGQWLTVEARMLVPTRGGTVFVAGPAGAPRELPSWFDGSTLHARFAPWRVGKVTVQVVAEVGSGPRPVLEATVFADADPPTIDHVAPAPGEDLPDCAGSPSGGGAAGRLGRMRDAARASAGLPPVPVDAALASVARAHAAQMAKTHWLGHDAGDGNPEDRLLRAGVDARQVAENVVHAPTVALAHRALWASPSHRANMLLPGVRRAGVGVVRDELGEAWAVEMEAR